MVKDIKELPRDIEAKLQKVGFREACLIVDTTLDEMEGQIPTDTWRLIDSGFGYVNGRLVKDTDKGRSNNRLDIMEPDGIVETSPGKHHYDITICYHTPKPVGEQANVSKMYHGERVFDYAPYVLEGGGATAFKRTSSFRSRRASAFLGMAKKVGSHFSKTQLKTAINRGLESGLSRAAMQIVRDLT